MDKSSFADEHLNFVLGDNYLDNINDFDIVLKLARFYALSQGRNNMTYDDYEFVDYLEKERKKRISELIQTKK